MQIICNRMDIHSIADHDLLHSEAPIPRLS